VGCFPAPGGPPTPSQPGVGARPGVAPAHGPVRSRTPRRAPDGRGCRHEQRAATAAAQRAGDDECWGLGPGVLRLAGRSPSEGRRCPEPPDAPPSMSGNAADERGIAKAGQDDIRARAIEIAWGWRRCQPARALTRWSQQRLGPGSSRLRRIGMVALARQLRMALWRLVETGVGPHGAALKAAVGLSPHPGSTSYEAVRRWAAREETGFAVRTDLAKGRPTTARSRRDERMLDQVFGGKRPTRREGGLRRMRLTPPRARGTVAARRDARNSLTSTATSKGSSAGGGYCLPSASRPRRSAEEGASISIKNLRLMCNQCALTG
jgi:hypothetical protein